MPKITFPNQRTIIVHREKATSNFLGIKNENWQAAAQDLGAHALMLYLYLASNANGYNLALSPVAVNQAIGMPRSTYHDQFTKLVNRGYLVAGSGNTFDFYEVPQKTSHGEQQNNCENGNSTDELNFYESSYAVKENVPLGENVPREDIQINNTNNDINKKRINKDGLVLADKVEPPKVVKVTIPVPKAERKEEIKNILPKKEFKF